MSSQSSAGLPRDDLFTSRSRCQRVHRIKKIGRFFFCFFFKVDLSCLLRADELAAGGWGDPFLFPVRPLMVYPARYVLHNSCYCHRWTNWSLETATTSVCCHVFPVITGLLSQAAQCWMPTVKHVWQGFDLCGKRKWMIFDDNTNLRSVWKKRLQLKSVALS